MGYTLKLAIPLALGIGAFIVNTMVLSTSTKRIEFVRVKSSMTIEEGQPFTEDALEVLDFPANEAGSLLETAVQWKDQSVLWDRPAMRDLLPGDIVLYRDFPLRGDSLQLLPGESSQLIQLGGINIPPAILEINNQLEFLIQLDDRPPIWVGPFRLVSVGNRVSSASSQSGTGSISSSLTVAVRGDLKDKPNLTVIDQEQLQDQDILDEFAAKEKKHEGQLLNVRIDPGAVKPKR